MKRFFKFMALAITTIFLIFLFLFVNEVSVSNSNLFDKDYDSNYIYVLNRSDKSEVEKKNHKTKAYPASLTKIMTTIVALEHIEDLSEIAPIDIDSYREMVSQNSSMAGFYSREATSYRDLLYGTVLSSGGEAANSLAVNIAGSIEAFVGLMNEKAVELGLKDTHFTSPEGLHDKKQYTTAYDMARLLDYALENGDFRAIFTSESFLTTSTLDHPNGILLKSTVLSKLDSSKQDGFKIIGGKSGTTYDAGQCWASLAVKDDVEYIAILMGSELKNISHPSNKHIEDTLKIYRNIN